MGHLSAHDGRGAYGGKVGEGGKGGEGGEGGEGGSEGGEGGDGGMAPPPQTQHMVLEEKSVSSYFPPKS